MKTGQAMLVGGALGVLAMYVAGKAGLLSQSEAFSGRWPGMPYLAGVKEQPSQWKFKNIPHLS
jgi:hypothetical protein